MKASRIAALGLVAGAGLWIASGHFLPRESAQSNAAIRTGDAESKKLFRVAVVPASVIAHSRKLVVSGRTEADKRVTVMARTGGVLTELKVRRGDWVKAGDVIAVLSDDAREAQVAQAKALVTQRKTELDAKQNLLRTGAIPRLEGVNLEAQLEAAKAALASAEAERERGVIRAPWDGFVSDLPGEVGRAAMSFMGADIVTLVALNPMLGGIKVGDMAEARLVTGESAQGKVRFVAKTASQTTRTYRVEVELPNPDYAIPDGITAEVSLPLAPTPAARVPRSALTISSTGDIGVRTVADDGTVAFVSVGIVEDEQTYMWVSGLGDDARVIVQGQDFVRDGQKVEAVDAKEVTATTR